MDNTPILISVPIIENIELAARYFRIKLSSTELASRIKPGQFFHIRVADRLDIILRRPFSLFSSDETCVSILYEVVGKGTEELSLKRPGEELSILGPLGNGFSINPAIKKVIITGGGIGIAPLFSLAKELVRMKGLELEVLIGARNRYKVLCEEDFKGIGINPKISTDDGSYGFKGTAAELLRNLLVTYDLRTAVCIYGCGPFEMLKEISCIAKEQNISCELSLDRHMGCGIGVCLGCVVKTIDGKYKRVCKDGPVFNAEEIDWL